MESNGATVVVIHACNIWNCAYFDSIEHAHNIIRMTYRKDNFTRQGNVLIRKSDGAKFLAKELIAYRELKGERLI